METITQLSKALYTAKTHTTGGRGHGISQSSDGHLDIKLSLPGAEGTGTNPEQLFAAGWSACFEGAMAVVARRKHVSLPEDTSIDAEIDLCLDGREYFLEARLNVSLPGLDKKTAKAIVDDARNVCPYSKALEGNVDIEFNLV